MGYSYTNQLIRGRLAIEFNKTNVLSVSGELESSLDNT